MHPCATYINIRKLHTYICNIHTYNVYICMSVRGQIKGIYSAITIEKNYTKGLKTEWFTEFIHVPLVTI